MTFEIQKAKSLDGARRRWILSPNGVAFISCPSCGQMVSLGAHRVEADGVVPTQIECPYKGCGFKEHIRLVNWEPPDA